MPAPGEHYARLISLNAPLKGKEFPVRGAVTTLGRGLENNIVIDLASVSRAHVRIERIGQRYRVRDMESRNGVKLNDQPVFEAFLEHGDVLLVGDALFKFVITSAPPPAEPDSAEASAPASAAADKPATKPAELPVASRAPHPVVEADAPVGTDVPPSGVRKSVLIATLAVTFLIIVGGAILAFRLAASKTPAVRTLTLPPVKLQVNENRLVPIRRTIVVNGKEQSELVDFKNDSFQFTDPSVVRVTRFEGEAGYVVLTGLAGGATDVTMKSLNDNIMRLRVIVRGRFTDRIEVITSVPMTDTERVQQADAHVASANRLAAAGSAYDALQEYRTAVALLTPTANRGTLYVNAVEGVANMEKSLDSRYKELAASIRQAISSNDYAKQTAYLQELLRLIPDQNDPRHQKAELRLKVVGIEMAPEGGQ